MHYEIKIKELITPLLRQEGLSVYHVEWTKDLGRQILRVYIERENSGVTLDDCTKASHSIEDLILVKGDIDVAYHLEVSSPGLNRLLANKGHFERVIGQNIRLRTKRPLDGRANYKGVLKAVSEANLVVEVDKKDFTIPLQEIGKASLEYQ